MTSATDFPVPGVTPGSLTSITGLPCPQLTTCSAGFLAEFSPGAAAINYATYLGGAGSASDGGSGSAQDQAKAMALDSSGDVYLGGLESSEDFPTTPANALMPGSPHFGSHGFFAVITMAVPQAVVPNVVGQTQAAATTAITGAGLVLGTVSNASSSTVPSGNVISESPVAGTLVNAGSAVNLVVSAGSNLAMPVITWSNPAAITYGTALSTTQLDATATYNGASVAGTFTYTPAKGTVLTAGTQILSVTFSPRNTAKYAAPPSASVTLQVNQAKPKITWVKPAAITYGTALSGTQLDATASVAGSFVYSPTAGTVLTAGAQTLSVTFIPYNIDYARATDTVTITVNQASSTTTITSNIPNPATVGQVVTMGFLVKVTFREPTGSVTVTASTGESCSGPLSAGAGSCTLTFTASGSPKLTASYGGDSNFKSSSSAKVTETVN